jgi:hypothetical protein
MGRFRLGPATKPGMHGVSVIHHGKCRLTLERKERHEKTYMGIIIFPLFATAMVGIVSPSFGELSTHLTQHFRCLVNS